MKKITWFVNEFGDVELYDGELDLNEIKSSKHTAYIHEDEARDFLMSIGVYEAEIGDWDSTLV